MKTEITANNSNIDYRFSPMRQIKIHMPEKIAEGFIALILQVYSIVGQRISVEDVKILAIALADDCTKRYSSLSMADVSKALNDGARGIYGEFITPSLKLFNEWLRLYRQTYTPLVINHQSTTTTQPQPHPSHDQNMQQLLQILATWYNTHHSLDNFYAPLIFDDIYTWLEQKGHININNDQKWELFETVKAHTFKKLQLKAKSSQEAKTAKRLADIVAGIITPTTTDKQTIKQTIKRECHRICIEKHLATQNQLSETNQ